MSPFFERLDGLNDRIAALAVVKRHKALGPLQVYRARKALEEAEEVCAIAVTALEKEYSSETANEARKLLDIQHPA